MPYLTRADRRELEYRDNQHPTVPGELNYLFTRLITQYIQVNKESYKTYNDIIGALECCKLELYRRLIGEYENLKRSENGDVF